MNGELPYSSLVAGLVVSEWLAHGPWFLRTVGVMVVLFAAGAATLITRRYRYLLAVRTQELNQARGTLRSTLAQLEAISRQVFQVQESERRSLARELHDELGQNLTAIKLLLHSAESTRSREPLQDAKALVSDVLQKVRQISLDLRPAMLDDLGLLPTLEWHLKKFATQTGIQVRFNHSESLHRLPPEIEITAYRVVQEALTNIARHADVKEARVEILDSCGDLWLNIEDRGKGFVPALSSDSSGLSGMRERIELLHGQVEIRSRLGVGTKITVWMPCDRSTPIAA